MAQASSTGPLRVGSLDRAAMFGRVLIRGGDVFTFGIFRIQHRHAALASFGSGVQQALQPQRDGIRESTFLLRIEPLGC